MFEFLIGTAGGLLIGSTGAGLGLLVTPLLILLGYSPSVAVGTGLAVSVVSKLAGTLMHVGRGYWPESQVAAILNAEDRTQAGPTAPAKGLFLMRVTYER